MLMQPGLLVDAKPSRDDLYQISTSLSLQLSFYFFIFYY